MNIKNDTAIPASPSALPTSGPALGEVTRRPSLTVEVPSKTTAALVGLAGVEAGHLSGYVDGPVAASGLAFFMLAALVKACVKRNRR
ncbi:hypothetical protein [Streptomyces sp. NPDC002952]|uniref:hypothetical protein n=1 Tax=Streptomyces sp. NPDC002952 TaxID=3364673 RepID=UPI0036ABA2DC